MGIFGCNNNLSNRTNEVYITNSDLVKLDVNIIHVCHSICKIKCLNNIGTGFFIKLIKWNRQELYFLITNEHVIKREFVKSKESVEILYDCEKKKHEFVLNDRDRFIKDFKDKEIDIIIIQIIEKDNIKKNYFLSPYMGEISNLMGKKIYILQFLKGEDLCLSKGYILEIQKYELIHSASTGLGSSGSPIFLENSSEVIAIHKQGHLSKEKNYGNFIYPIIESLKINNKNEYNEIDNYLLKYNQLNNYKEIYINDYFFNIDPLLNRLQNINISGYDKNDSTLYGNNLLKSSASMPIIQDITNMNKNYAYSNSYNEFTIYNYGQNNKNSIYCEEIISDNNSSEYYRECFSKIVKNYSYCENSNSKYRKYMEDKGKTIENLNNDPNKILFCIFDGHRGEQVSNFLQEIFPKYMKKAFPLIKIIFWISEIYSYL